MESPDASRQNYARRDACVVIAATLLAAIICARFDVGEAVTRWTRPYERLQLDELPLILLVIALGLIIGERLGLSPKTAANPQSSIKQKLGASSALQLILIAQQYGLDSAK